MYSNISLIPGDFNQSLMTWVNGTSSPGSLQVQVYGMDLLILINVGIFTASLIIIYLLIQARKRDLE